MTTSTTQQDYYPSGTYSPYQQTDNQIAVQSPPQYEVSRDSFENAGRYSVSTARNSTGGLLQKPVVVPQSTNIFMIKTFSPFARCYSPALAQLPKPIGQEEFLTFIDGLNESFLSAPVFQAIHVAGGMMMGAQGILPVQAVGAVLQIGGVAASAGVSFVRVRKYLKKQQAALFAPRGLVVKVMSTKQMMAAVGYTEAVKGKLQLPPLENTADIGAFGDVPATKPGLDGQVQLGPEDPRVRRLRALEAYVAPINFDVPEDTKPIGWAKRWSTAPLRWINKKQTTKIDKVREKSLKKRAEKAPEVEAENIKMQNELADLERRIQALKAQGASEDELAYLESQQLELMEAREKAIADIYKSGDKKLIKTYKKEEKIANRILWVVITRADGTSPDELFQVGSTSTQTTAT